MGLAKAVGAIIKEAQERGDFDNLKGKEKQQVNQNQSPAGKEA